MTALASILLLVHSARIRSLAHEPAIRHTLSFLLIVTEMSYYWRLVQPELGATPARNLPVTMCGWACILMSYALTTRNKTLFDICYYWIFTGSLIAMATPAVLTRTGPGYFRYYQFWLEHSLVVLSAVYLMTVHGMRPRRWSALTSLAALTPLAVLAIYLNNIYDEANYLFIAVHREGGWSIADALPRDPTLRLLAAGLIILLLFGIVYAPFPMASHIERAVRARTLAASSGQTQPPGAPGDCPKRASCGVTQRASEKNVDG